MRAETLIQLAEKWFAAFNTKNLEGLLALYDDNAMHFSPKLLQRRPETKGFVTGKDALRAWWKDAFERLPTLKYIPNKYTAGSDRIFMEYTRTVAGEPNMLVAEVLEVKNGVIVESRVYHG